MMLSISKIVLSTATIIATSASLTLIAEAASKKKQEAPTSQETPAVPVAQPEKPPVDAFTSMVQSVIPDYQPKKNTGEYNPSNPWGTGGGD